MLATIVSYQVMSAGLRRLIATPSPQGDALGLFNVRQTGLIIEMALIEGPALLNAIAYYLEGQTLALLMALACAASMAIRFPTSDAILTWVDQRHDELREVRKA